MWPWGHAAVGYLLWSTIVRRIGDRPPRDGEVWLLALGTQFPDLVDKPLAWFLGVLPSGRSLAHSLLTATLVIAVVHVLVARRGGKSLAVAFGVGYVSHSLADALAPLAGGEYDKLTYLLWPVLPAPVYESESLGSNLDELGLSAFVVAELALVVVAIVLWRFDGMPGLPDAVRAGVR